MSLEIYERPSIGEMSLTELAHVANASHEAMREGLQGVFQHIFAAGDALNEARNRFNSSKEWLAWIEQNFAPGAFAAYNYMRVAFYKDALPEEAMQPQVGPTGKVYQPTISTARRSLRGLPAIRDIYANRTKFDRDEAKRLRDSGLTYTQISETLGVSQSVVRVALNPKTRATQERAHKRYQDKRRREKAALKAAEQNAFVKAAGGDLSEAYSLIRKALQRADSASAHAQYGYKSRRTIARAVSSLHNAEDAIAEALKLGDA